MSLSTSFRRAICNSPISLEESKVTEDGKPVHEECYYQKIKARKDLENLA